MSIRIPRRIREQLDVDVSGAVAGDALVLDVDGETWVPGAGGGGGGSDDQTAAEVPFTPAGNVAATDVQAAIAELDSEKTTAAATSAAIAALSSVYQPLDADLSAIAALTTSAFGRSLLELADATALGANHDHAGDDITSGTVADARIASTIARDSEVTSAIAALSTVYQPLDSDLTAIAALTTTAFGRSFLSMADAAAVRAALDLEAGTDFPALSTFNDHSARHEDGGADEISLTGLSGAPADTINKAIVDAKGDLIVATAADTVARVAVGSNDQVLVADSAQSAGVRWATPSSGPVDPVLEMFGAPATQLDFDTSTSGLTMFSVAASVQGSHTIVPHCFYVQHNVNQDRLIGGYVAASAPCTVIVKIADGIPGANYNLGGLVVCAADPDTRAKVYGLVNDNQFMQMNHYDNGVDADSTGANGTGPERMQAPYYLGARCISAGNAIDWMWSDNGRLWHKTFAASGFGAAVGAVGVGLSSTGSAGYAMAWDFLYVYNSALTMPGKN